MTDDQEPMQIAAQYIAHRFKHANEAPKARRLSFRDLGVRYGMTHVHARSIARGQASPGKDVIQRVATRDFGGSLDDLMRVALAWHQELVVEERTKHLEHVSVDPGLLPGWLEAPLRYPRMRGPLLMGLDRQMAQEFLQRFACARRVNGELLSADDWWVRLQAAWSDHMLQRGPELVAEARELTTPDSSPQLDPKLVTGTRRASKRGD